ncbi:hypothetical protein [Chroococcidiopsis cubana]|uniref:hypothetical protein n=1 Tax=Chroococcidiopsis cubana TaxID=171392 RepID=UPI002ACE41D6|nr:hypothetical protein [Chroococcidiopsis cubana]
MKYGFQRISLSQKEESILTSRMAALRFNLQPFPLARLGIEPRYDQNLQDDSKRLDFSLSNMAFDPTGSNYQNQAG